VGVVGVTRKCRCLFVRRFTSLLPLYVKFTIWEVIRILRLASSASAFIRAIAPLYEVLPYGKETFIFVIT
jgi:hypothetical protein